MLKVRMKEKYYLYAGELHLINIKALEVFLESFR